MLKKLASAVLCLPFLCLVGVADKKPLSLAELQQLKYATAPVGQVQQVQYELIPYSDLRVMFDLLPAYASGAQILDTFREPVLTRSPRGTTIFKTISPAVVLVVVGEVVREEYEPSGMGTGAIVRSDGYVLTNWHVIKDHRGAIVFLKPPNAADISDKLAYVATVVYQDQLHDLALLKMLAPPVSLPTIRIADPSSIQVAEDIHIIGHPHGNLWSYSTGVVSQVRDSFTWTYVDGSHHAAKVLQMQTAINPGNSGGPVIDDSGAMLGLVAMSEEGQNLNYAIAADVIQGFLNIGYSFRTRGPSAPTIVPEKLYNATSRDGFLVRRIEYSDPNTYLVTAEQGQAVEWFAVNNRGWILHAFAADQSGAFTKWEAWRTSGTIIRPSIVGTKLESLTTAR